MRAPETGTLWLHLLAPDGRCLQRQRLDVAPTTGAAFDVGRVSDAGERRSVRVHCLADLGDSAGLHVSLYDPVGWAYRAPLRRDGSEWVIPPVAYGTYALGLWRRVSDVQYDFATPSFTLRVPPGIAPLRLRWRFASR
ncbi:MAG: hypothetical protein ACYTG6_16875 [Planctomycetota bacterium]